MSERTTSRLLVIEQDLSLADTLSQHFTGEGYQVEIARTGHDGIEKARTMQPSLILLAARLGDFSGLDAFRILRSKPRTGHIPVMMLASKDETMLQYEVLEAGAYDFIEKPIDLDILALRVRNVLRRVEREGLAEPRTGLPTGRLLAERVEALPEQTDWYKIELVIANFSDFRDLYGFVTANEALRFAGNLITQLVNEHGTSDDFVGHVAGTETFVLITTEAQGPTLQRALADRVTHELRSFYNFMERDQGHVLVEDGSGGHTQRPLMSARITVSQRNPDAGTAPADDDPWEDAVDDTKKTGDSGEESPFAW